MRSVVVLAVLASGCGRVGFEHAADAGPDGDLAGLTTYRDAVLTDGPVAYWRLGDADNVARDELGNVNGTYVGGCERGDPGALAGDADPAVGFDGTSCHVALGDTLAFAGNAPFTFELWVTLARIDNYQFFIAKQTRNATDPVDGYGVLQSPTGIYLERIKNLISDSTSKATVVVNQFYYLVAIYDGAQLALYRDGTMVGTAQPDLVAMGTYSAPTMLGVGSTQTAYLNGVMDEVAIYDKALTAEQVALHYDIGRNGPR